jgi:hypothetical protein
MVLGGSTRRIQYAFRVLRWQRVALVSLVLGCDAPPSHAPSANVPDRPVVLRNPSHRAAYERARDGVRSMKSQFGTVMTPEFVTELGFRCADLRGDARALASEDDPLVQRAKADVELLCGLEVPVASARMEIDRIEKKRREDPRATLKRECIGLKLALGDIGSQYADNPMMGELAGKYATLCPAE